MKDKVKERQISLNDDFSSKILIKRCDDMARLSDQIERMLLEMIEAHNGLWEFSRKDLASQMNCVPSQISYVLSTRFRDDLGYVIESKRGGGGSVVIRRIDFVEGNNWLVSLYRNLPDSLTQQESEKIWAALVNHQVIDEDWAEILKSIVSQPFLAMLPQSQINSFRAQLVKKIIKTMIAQHRG